jgi:hypothetical protein
LLFDLAEDPNEENNLSGSHPTKVHELRQKLARLNGGTREAQAVPLSSEEEEMLRAIGYIE